MNNISNNYDRFLSLMNGFNSAPAGEIVAALAKETSVIYPRAFTKIESALSSGTAVLTAPFHILKDLILAAIAAPFAPFSSTVKAFAINRSISTGINFAALFTGIGGIVYPFTPFPQWIRKKIPQLAPDISTVVADGIQNTIKNVTKDHPNNILKMGEWFENNGELVNDMLQEIPQLKPLAPLLPHVKQTLEEIYILQNKEKVLNMLVSLEKLNNASCVGIILATMKNHSSKHGKIFKKIDSAVAFGTVSLTVPLQLITHLFLAAISAPFGLGSARSKAFCATQLFKVKLSFACFAIGLVGLFNPEKAEELFTRLTLNYLPRKWREPAEKLWNSFIKLSEQDIKNILESFSIEKLKVQFSNVLPKLIQISQNYPDGVKRLIELGDLLGLKLPEELSASVVPLIAELASIEEKHPGVIQNVTEIVMNNEWKQFPQLLGKDPELSKDIIEVIAEKPDLTKALIEIPAFKEAIPPELAKDMPNIIQDGAKIVKDYPEIISELSKLPNDENQFTQQKLDEVTKKYPGLEEKIQKFMQSYPELEKMLTSNDEENMRGGFGD